MSRTSSSSKLELCDPYAWEDPRYIVRSLHKEKVQCASEMVNKAICIYLIALLLAFVLSSVIQAKGLYVAIGVLATIYLIPTFLHLRAVEVSRNTPSSAHPVSEGFEVEAKEDIIGKDTSEYRNPFHNVMIDDYKYAPTRDGAPSILTQKSKDALDAFFRVQWSSDPTDVFGKTQSQRMFITQPNTTIPNDQGSYQDWLYRIPGLTCKEGNVEACYGGTNGGAMPWVNL